jgi:ABC-type spermidine/putrescine transport system permease subunit II
MLPRVVTYVYLIYLVTPILLLFVGSFGDLWLGTLLPTGFTTRWYVEVANDPSFQRAFVASLVVAGAACAACLAIGLPLAYAVFKARDPRIRALSRALYQLPIALPPLVPGTSCSGCLTSCRRWWRTCSDWACRCSKMPRSPAGAAGCSATCTLSCRRCATRSCPG